MKTYLSWDVGISNLAYCLLEKTSETNFNIKKWGIINLNEECNICCKCSKKAIFYSLKEDLQSMIYYCKTHSKEYKPKEIDESSCKETDKCKHQIKENNCNKKAFKSIEGISYCKNHCDLHKKKLTKERSLNKINSINSNKIPIQDLTNKLIRELDKNPDFKNVNEVLIENQPTLINPTMKTISCILFTYFILRGVVETNKIEQVKFLSPSNKLKVSDDANKKLKQAKDTGVNKKKVYKMTKNLGIKFCKELIKDDIVNLEFINKQIKKDDLCDSFLQAYYHVFCKNGVPKNVQEILDKLTALEESINEDDKAIDLTDLEY